MAMRRLANFFHEETEGLSSVKAVE